jgi:hypothetical protein
LAVLLAVVPAVVIEALFEMWLDAWVFRPVDAVWDRGVSQFPFDHSIDRFAEISHTSIHAICISFERTISSQAGVSAQSESQMPPLAFHLSVQLLDLVARVSVTHGGASKQFDHGAGGSVEIHCIADQVVARVGAFDSVRNVFGAMLYDASFTDCRGPRISGLDFVRPIPKQHAQSPEGKNAKAPIAPNGIASLYQLQLFRRTIRGKQTC